MLIVEMAVQGPVEPEQSICPIRIRFTPQQNALPFLFLSTQASDLNEKPVIVFLM